MKWLFLLLLAVNIALFLWGWEKERQTPRQMVVLEPELGSLRLLSEVSAETGTEPGDRAVVEDDRRQAPGPVSVVDESAVESESGDSPATSSAEVGPVTKSALETAASNRVDGQSRVSPPAVAPPAAEEPVPASGPIDTAVREVPEAAAETEAVAPKIDRVCGVIGPIEEEDRLRRIVSDLVEGQITASQRTESTLRTVGFWVIIEPYGSQKQAIDAVNTLKQRGITDLRRFYKGRLKNGISLGMYRREQNAETRRRQIAAKGFPAELLARRKKVPLYFIDYQGSPPLVEGMRKKLATQYPDISVHVESCPRIATPGGIF